MGLKELKNRLVETRLINTKYNPGTRKLFQLELLTIAAFLVDKCTPQLQKETPKVIPTTAVLPDALASFSNCSKDPINYGFNDIENCTTKIDGLPSFFPLLADIIKENKDLSVESKTYFSELIKLAETDTACGKLEWRTDVKTPVGLYWKINSESPQKFIIVLKSNNWDQKQPTIEQNQNMLSGIHELSHYERKLRNPNFDNISYAENEMWAKYYQFLLQKQLATYNKIKLVSNNSEIEVIQKYGGVTNLLDLLANIDKNQLSPLESVLGLYILAITHRNTYQGIKVNQTDALDKNQLQAIETNITAYQKLIDKFEPKLTNKDKNILNQMVNSGQLKSFFFSGLQKPQILSQNQSMNKINDLQPIQGTSQQIKGYGGII